MSTGLILIARERVRQKQEENWTPEHDDSHFDGELWKAAVAYILFNSPIFCGMAKFFCPWSDSWWKPDNTSAVRNFTKAGALIVAEIDRRLRIESRQPK